MRTDDERAAYKQAYIEFTAATLSALATVDTPESASTFVSQAAQQLRDLSAKTPEFYAEELLDTTFKEALSNWGSAELADIEQTHSDANARTHALEAEMNARMNAARVSGDRDAEHALWREVEVRRAESQAEIDALTRRAHLVSVRLDACERLQASLGSKEPGTLTNQKFAPEKAAASVAAVPFSVADELAKLAKLKADGVLTEEEFAAQKRKLLS
jgi:hypothetical protein